MRDRTAYIQADLRDPATILTSPTVREVLDFSQPVGLILVAVLQFIHDEFKPAAILATLLDALPSGSYLAASHVTGEHLPTEAAATIRTYRSSGVSRGVRALADWLVQADIGCPTFGTNIGAKRFKLGNRASFRLMRSMAH